MDLDLNFIEESTNTHNRLKFYRFSQSFRRLLDRQNQNRFLNESFSSHSDRRQIIFEFLKPLSQRLDYAPVTLYTAIGLFDSVISQFFCSQIQMRKIALVCLSISSKLHEIKPLQYKQLPFLIFSVSELNQIEKRLIQNLDYKINMITHFHLVLHMLDLLSSQITSELFSQYKDVVSNISFIITSSYNIYMYTPVSLALTVLQICENITNVQFRMLPWIFQLAGLDEDDIQESFHAMRLVIQEFYANRQQRRQVKSDLDRVLSQIETSSFMSLNC